MGSARRIYFWTAISKHSAPPMRWRMMKTSFVAPSTNIAVDMRWPTAAVPEG